MQRRSRHLGCGVMVASVALVAAACQADDGGSAVEGTPIEEPSPVTDSTSEPTNPPPTTPPPTTPPPTTSSPTTPPTATTPDAADETTPPADPTTTLVLATQPAKATAPAVTSPPGEPSTQTIYEVGSIDPGLAPFITMASDHLAERLDMDPASIEVLTAVLVTWPDSALGCREPDRAYAPTLIDGSVIELGADELVYRYHGGGDRAPFPCDRPLDPVPRPLS